MALISLAEWAAREGISPVTARKKAQKGLLITAQKIGRNWVIDEREKNEDYRTAAPHTEGSANLITLPGWAQREGISAGYARKLASEGRLAGAIQIKGRWLVRDSYKYKG